MAIYHMQAKVVSRGSGRSAVAASAYMSCSRMYNDYDGIQHDYTRKHGLIYQEVMLPPMAPSEWNDREQLWNAVWSKSKTVKAIYEKGYSGSKSNTFDYLCKIEQKENKCFEPQPYVRTMTECLKYKIGSKGKDKDYITREGVFRNMWMNTELSDNHKKYIYEKYPNIWELQCCIKEFRNIFKNHNVPMLYLLVEKYSKSLLKPLRSFAEGLKRDIDAVENAVAYDYSNGFVEGTNSRLKMIKRTMYGRCGRQLLEAKLRYMGYNNNNG